MTDAAPIKKRRKKTKSPTARTLEECRKRGWVAQVVERTIGRTFIKQDLFGCIDIVALTKPDDGLLGVRGTVGIQATSGSNHAARRDKILAEPRMLSWLEAGNRLELWTWAKRGKTKRWTLRVESFRVSDFGVSEESAA